MKHGTNLFWQIILVLLVVLVALWCATEWTAWSLGWSPRLGEPLFVILDMPVYVPWAFFGWWYSFDAYAPDVFDRGGLIAGSGGVAAIVIAVTGSILRARWDKRVSTFGSARWAEGRDLRKSGLLKPAGVFLGQAHGSYLRHDGPDHVMAFAPTRSGKGVGLVVPTLLSWPHSVLVHDIKGENWQLTSGWRSEFSHCLRFDPTDVASAHFNPLMEVRKGPCEVRDVQNIANILVDPQGKLGDLGHWVDKANSLLVGVILHVLYAEREKTLARVASFLADPDRTFRTTLSIMLRTNHLGTGEAPKVHPVVAETARELMNQSENELSGVLSTALRFLSPASASVSFPDLSAFAPSREAAFGSSLSEDPNRQVRKLDFLDEEPDLSIYNPHRLETPVSPFQLMAGTIIPATLLTGVNSDLPGQVIAQVTSPVYDTVTGETVLVPQGARLIGRYDSVIAFGQSRALLVWSRIVMPDGSSIRIDNLAGVDARGYAGLEDKVDYHSWKLLQGVALSTLLGVGAELGTDDEGDIARALRRSAQTGVNEAGQEIVRRNLDVQPSITIRPGWRLGVLVNKDIVLKPYEEGHPQ